MTPALELHQVSHAFGARPALQDVSFAVPQGGFAVLLGLNGAGNTTLFSIVTRLYRARTGRVHVLGRELEAAPLKALAAMGVVFQAPTLDPELTVRQSMRYHGALHGLSRVEADARAQEELVRLGMEGHAGRRVGTLSGGERRRVELARALLTARACCCWTSRRSGWMCRAGTPSWRMCVPCAGNAAWRRSRPCICWTRWRKPTCSCCCTAAGCCVPGRRRRSAPPRRRPRWPRPSPG